MTEPTPIPEPLDGSTVCFWCKGTGTVKDQGGYGTQDIPCPACSPPPAPEQFAKECQSPGERGNCPECNGTGGYQPAYVSGGEIVGPDACSKCDGTGDVASPPHAPEAAGVELELPDKPGVWTRDGQWWLAFYRQVPDDYGEVCSLTYSRQLLLWLVEEDKVGEGQKLRDIPRGHWQPAQAGGEVASPAVEKAMSAYRGGRKLVEEIESLKASLTTANERAERAEAEVCGLREWLADVRLATLGKMPADLAEKIDAHLQKSPPMILEALVKARARVASIPKSVCDLLDAKEAAERERDEAQTSRDQLTNEANRLADDWEKQAAVDGAEADRERVPPDTRRVLGALSVTKLHHARQIRQVVKGRS